MCGAFAILHPFKEVGRPFNAGYQDLDLPPKYNARPGQKLPVILNSNPSEIKLVNWGIRPSWGQGKMIINARQEGLQTKMTFAQSFRQRRCIIPADAFYEWGEIAGKKYPFLFRLKDQSTFGFAGLWQMDPKSRQQEFTIITTQPNSVVKKVHDRMPAMLSPDKKEQWLDDASDIADLQKMLEPYPAKEMEGYPVSDLVNSPKNDNPRIIEPVKI